MHRQSRAEDPLAVSRVAVPPLAALPTAGPGNGPGTLWRGRDSTPGGAEGRRTKKNRLPGMDGEPDRRGDTCRRPMRPPNG